MARSDFITIIPLDRASRILGVDSYHFNSIVTTRRPESNACDDMWFQYAWQRVGAAGRDDLAVALKETEEIVIKNLGTSPLPIWVEDEEQILTKPYAVELRSWGINSRFRPKSVQSNLGFVLETGRKTKTLIDDALAIVYSDADGDGYSELATVTVVTTVTEAQEIHVYFPGQSGADSWEIRPINVSISGGTATITFSRYLVPDPDLWIQDPSPGDIWRAIDGDVVGNFLTTVDAYRVYTDVSDQALFYSEQSCSTCNGIGCEECNWTTETGCLKIRDSRLGTLAYLRADWDEDDEVFDVVDWCCGEPDKVTINYRAGLIDKTQTYPYLTMNPMWERAIVYYAYTRLDRQDSRCENTGNIWSYWTTDLARSTRDSSFVLAPKDLQCPLGTTRAAIQLWRMIETNRILRG